MFQPQYQQTQQQPQQSQQPLYATRTTENSNQHARSISFSSPAPIPIMHHRPFYLSSGSGSRYKNFKGTFGRFEYDAPPAASGVNRFGQTMPLPAASAATAASRDRRQLDLRGAPLQLHRGLTVLRARTLPTGQIGPCIPLGNMTMNGSKEHEWHPNPYEGGGMLVHEHFRNQRAGNPENEGLAGVKARQTLVASLHPQAFTQGANQYHELFDRDIRGNSPNETTTAASSSAATAAAATAAQTDRQRMRVKHKTPFLSSAGPGTIIGSDRGFVGKHAQHPYHYSDYSLSEKSLRETKVDTGTGVGFRLQCAHHIHHPMKSTTALPSRIGGETSRHSNFHAIQSPDETCRHRCNEVLQQAHTSRGNTSNGATSQIGQTARF